MFVYLFKISFSKSILLTFIFAVVMLIPDVVIMVTVVNILGFSKDFCYNVFAGSILSNIIGSLVFLIVAYILRKPLNKILSVKLENSKKIIIFSVLTFLCVAIFFYNAFSDLQLNQELIVSVAIMLTFIVILFNLFSQTIKNNRLKTEYDKLLEFMTTYEVEIEKERMLRHETKNQLLTIKAKMADDDAEVAVIEYIDDILNENSVTVNQEKYAKFGSLPPNGLKALFYFKTMEAENKDITVNISISKQIEGSFIYNLDNKQFSLLGKLLGVYIDNAIDASSKSEDKVLGFEVYPTKKGIEFIISNSYGNIEIDKIGQKHYSTKGKSHGYGLSLVKEIILSNSKVFEQERIVTDKLYIQKLTIKKSI